MAMLHEGVSCDVCLTENFRGLRYKCLTCYDYDLCQRCFASKMVSSSHKASHPMQCLIAKGDFPLFYGPEPGITPGHHVTFTCPLCGQLGLSQSYLIHHVRTKHTGATQNVICPVCAGTPGCDPNVWTNDLSAHLTNRHASGGNGGSSNGASNVPKRRSGSTYVDDRVGALGVDPEDPIVDLLMQLSQMRNSPFGEGAGSSSRESASRSTSTLINRVQRNRMYAQFMQQHRHQASSGAGFGSIAHMTAAAAAAAADQVRVVQKSLKKCYGGANAQTSSSGSVAVKAPGGSNKFGVGHPATAAINGSNAAKEPEGRPDTSSHPWELCPLVLEEFERNGSKSSSPSSFEDESPDAESGESKEQVAARRNLKQTIVRSAFAQELFLSLLSLDDDDDEVQEEEDHDDEPRKMTRVGGNERRDVVPTVTVTRPDPFEAFGEASEV